MACNDERGLQVLDACRRCGVAVPDDVAVIGVDNDLPMCELAIPPLTSVDVNAEGIGYEAAALLDKMMAGKKAPTKPVMLPPRGVVTCRSTDLVASEDEDVSRAVRYIREHACNRLQVSDVLTHMGMSCASLQQRMKQIVGRTIHQEIQRAAPEPREGSAGDVEPDDQAGGARKRIRQRAIHDESFSRRDPGNAGAISPSSGEVNVISLACGL